MQDGTGRRARKKQHTRTALIDAATRLFDEKGYDGTTVADIAEEADVSTRTFFLHFPTKEDVVLGDPTARVDAGTLAISERSPDEPVRDVLARALDVMIADSWAGDLSSGLAAVRARLLTSVPAVQARLLQTSFTAQTRLAQALHDTCPDELDEIDAAALVGAAMGAVNAAAITSLRRGASPEQVRAAMQRAAAIALGRPA
ncbi:TetR/AcrR family transcriptional regulator [Pseudonocardia alaniniphila]|uniref:TetR/AcrR family transcriptional regulator n=1 Tax=Pseudonocardia alaniniphila TaxID=75291 RepID=A0ABS9TE60_9PSEU|nr:TetR/AcrR family transcriptional regulator [Pseudonocardia alaniniphila]MCH6166787.1 TetR/AcrR family transcriptional regulator [Pseudonocardia alaniniphila]